MQSADFDPDVYKNWFRRPTIFVACGWFLLAAAARIALPLALGRLALLLKQLGFADMRPFTSTAAGLLYRLGALAFPVVWYAARHPGVEQSMRLRAPHPVILGYAVLMGVAATPLANCLSLWWSLLLERLAGALPFAVRVPETPAELSQMLLMSALLPGICEELLFRGGVMGAWERRGAARALVMASVLFAALHGSVQGFPAQLCMGFAAGLIVLYGQSLFAGMAFHLTYNAITIMMNYIAGPTEEMNIYTYIKQTGGYASLILNTAAAVALGAILALGLWLLSGWLGLRAKNGRAPAPEPLEWRELLVLIAGLMTAAAGYLGDILALCGVA